MARYDKYDGMVGGFRAPLAAATADGDEFTLHGVGLDANGRVVLGSGNTGVIGAYIAHGKKNIGDIVDVMTDGEIVEVEDQTAGTAVYGAADGTLSAVNTDTYLGHTVEATRLVVRVAR